MRRTADSTRPEADPRQRSAERKKPRVSIIVAMARNRVIGRDGKLPWHISADLKRFRALTMGHHIVMGRRTWESIGRLLPGRRHVIVSRKTGYRVPGAAVVDSLAAAIEACKGDSEIFVIGGGEIYAQALRLADRIYATEILDNAEGDTYFPVVDVNEWQPVSREHCDTAESPPYDFVVYQRTSHLR